MTAETAAPTITELIARVMADVTHVGKDGRNTSQNFNFRGIDAVLNAVGPAFRTHGIVPKPKLKSVTYENILVGEKRTPMTRCTVKVKYRFKGPAGDYEDVTVPGEAFDSGDKGTAKAMSVAYRIALIQLLALPTTEPDPDESSYNRAPAAVTDPRWLADVRGRIDAATSHPVLQAIGEEVGAKANAGALAIADGTALQTAFDARWAHLQAEAPAQQGLPADHWETPQSAPPSPLMPKADQRQHARLAILLMAKRGISSSDDDVARAAISKLVNRTLASRTELTKAEAKSAIDLLAAEPDHVPLPEPPAAPVVLDENPVRDILASGIRDANSPTTLNEAGGDIAMELARGNITPAEADVLREAWQARRAELASAVAA